MVLGKGGKHRISNKLAYKLMKKSLLFIFVLLIIGLMLVGCTDPKTSAGDSTAAVPDLNQPGQNPGEASAAPVGTEGVEPAGETSDQTPPVLPDSAVPSDSDVEIMEAGWDPGGLTPAEDPTVVIGDGGFELVGGD